MNTRPFGSATLKRSMRRDTFSKFGSTLGAGPGLAGALLVALSISACGGEDSSKKAEHPRAELDQTWRVFRSHLSGRRGDAAVICSEVVSAEYGQQLADKFSDSGSGADDCAVAISDVSGFNGNLSYGPLRRVKISGQTASADYQTTDIPPEVYGVRFVRVGNEWRVTDFFARPSGPAEVAGNRGGSPEGQVRAVLKLFQSHGPAICGLVTENFTHDYYDSPDSCTRTEERKKGKPFRFEITELRITADEAEAQVRGKKGEGSIFLQKERGRWLVDEVVFGGSTRAFS